MMIIIYIYHRGLSLYGAKGIVGAIQWLVKGTNYYYLYLLSC